MLSLRGPIGIDVTSRTIHAVQVSRGKGRPTITAATTIPRQGDPRPFNAMEARNLAEVLARKQFKGRSIVAAVPIEDLMIDVVRLPAGAQPESIDAMAGAELGRAHRCEAGTFEMACWPVSRDPETSTMVAVGCAHERTEPLMDAFEYAGLRVTAIDVTPLALARACWPTGAVLAEPVAVVHLDWGAASIVLVRDGVVTYQRALPELGIAHTIDQVSETLDHDHEVTMHVVREVGLEMPDGDGPLRPELLSDARRTLRTYADTVASELKRSLQYVQQECDPTPVARALLVGEGARLPGLPAHLRSSLDLDASVVDVRDIAHVGPGLETICSTPALCAALGLALHTRK